MILKILSPILLLAGVAAAQADLRGIYVYTNDVSTINNATATQLTQSFSIPGINGVTIVIGCTAIEPTMGQYKWSVLDQWIAQVSALGKIIDLVMGAPLLPPVSRIWRTRAEDRGVAPRFSGRVLVTGSRGSSDGQLPEC